MSQLASLAALVMFPQLAKHADVHGCLLGACRSSCRNLLQVLSGITDVPGKRPPAVGSLVTVCSGNPLSQDRAEPSSCLALSVCDKPG